MNSIPVPLFSALIFTLSVALLPIGSRAADSPTASPNAATSPEGLVAEVLAKNPEVRFYDAEITAARASLKLSTQLAPPELNGSVGRKRTSDLAGNLAGEGTAWSAGVSQTIEWPGRIGLRKAIANHDLNLAELGRARFTNALAGRVRLLAYGISAAAERSRVTTEVAERFRALREVLVQRDPAGIAPALEIRILEATELGLRRKANQADLALRNLQAELNPLRGLPADSPVTVTWVEPSLGPVPKLEHVLASAQTNNFELRVRAMELEQQGFRVRLTRNERWPAFTVGTHYSEERSDARDQLMGISISVPLPLWKNTKAQTELAESRRQQAATVLGVAQRDLERRLTVAVGGYESQTAELARWRADSVDQFRSAADLADRHYRLGAVPAATYVELQKQYTDAVEALLETRREALESAQEIEQLSGVPVLGVKSVTVQTIPNTNPSPR
jgi:cobalt-zinc-cadmium efflux system outer membrane protein